MRSELAVALITAALAGWWLLSASRTPAASLPANAPAVGKAIIASGEPDGMLGVMTPVCNRSHAKLRADVVVESGSAGLADEDGRRIVPGQAITSFTAPPGSYCYVGLFRIKPHRPQPIDFRVVWQDGLEAHCFAQSIAPKDDGVTHLK